MSIKLIDRNKALEKLAYREPVFGRDYTKERYRFMQWQADVNAIKELKPVEAITKDQYEAKLKTDMVTMLTEIQLEIEKVPKYCMTYDATCVYRKAEEYISDINNIIQQKINALKKHKVREENE